MQVSLPSIDPNIKIARRSVSAGDHGYRGSGEVQSHRMYGVCVTYPKVRLACASEDDRGSLRNEISESDEDSASDLGSPAEAPAAGTPDTEAGWGRGNTVCGGAGQAKRAHSPTHGRDFSTRQSRRGGGRGNGKCGLGDEADVEVKVVRLIFCRPDIVRNPQTSQGLAT